MRTTIEPFSMSHGVERAIEKIKKFQEENDMEVVSITEVGSGMYHYLVVIFEPPVSDQDFELYRLRLLEKQ